LVITEGAGSINPRIAEAVVAYDPDHVVAMSVPLSDCERIAPGGLGFRDASGEPIDGSERAATVERLIEQEWSHDDPAAEIARNHLSQVCSPLRDHIGDRADHDVAISIKPGDSSRDIVTIAGIEDFEFKPCLAASPAWTSDAALLAAMRAGLVGNPTSDPSHPDRPEPSPNDLLGW
jgi:hypothetical protein